MMRVVQRKSTEQRGDTIVEVLLAMAVVGLVLGSSFGIANRSLRIGQSARERTTALKIAESQIELMKSIKTTAQFTSQIGDFCVTPNLPVTVVNVTDISDASNDCVQVNGDGGDGLYTIRISPPVAGGANSYAVNVSWTRIGASTAVTGTGIDTLTLYYKVGVL